VGGFILFQRRNGFTSSFKLFCWWWLASWRGRHVGVCGCERGWGMVFQGDVGREGKGKIPCFSFPLIIMYNTRRCFWSFFSRSIWVAFARCTMMHGRRIWREEEEEEELNENETTGRTRFESRAPSTAQDTEKGVPSLPSMCTRWRVRKRVAKAYTIGSHWQRRVPRLMTRNSKTHEQKYFTIMMPLFDLRSSAASYHLQASDS
jgi:hypothetical protein